MIRGNAPSLAPMYDVMCGEVWENVTKNLAQKIAGEGRGDYLKGRHWQRFARECGLNPKQVIDRVGADGKIASSQKLGPLNPRWQQCQRADTQF